MKVLTINGKDYRLPSSLNEFQQKLYIHLIDWKWQHITTVPGVARGHKYDAILPESYLNKRPMLYHGLNTVLDSHLRKFPFRIHKYFNHMASSQAANINLFLPILLNPEVNTAMSRLKPDFARLAIEELDNGYRIEFWDEPYGVLGDKRETTGTDSDIGIAYYNHNDELCLWLIEHKLTESEFTDCGGYRSKYRKEQHDCKKSFADILKNKHSCYYHDRCNYRYWNITESNRNFFVNHSPDEPCPFRGGMNQLWRNQLMALGIEQDDRQPYKQVSFSVVKHPDNKHLDKTIKEYQQLIGNNPKFTVLTSEKIVETAESIGNQDLVAWGKWYRELYDI